VRRVSICLALGLLFAPFSASSQPLPSYSLPTFSDAEVEALLTESRDQLVKSSEIIKEQSTLLQKASDNLAKSNEVMLAQSKNLKTLSILCAVLGGVIVIEGIGITVSILTR
jgi:hypothetical protein